MFSTCIFCQKPLGSNEVIEEFPVGRRLAFDGVKGRLWVVCRSCERWNLSPLEARWEAIEACERTYAGTTLRVATDNIGLARLGEGLELVRIGAPMRPEFAAWRYGDQFGRRRRRAIVIGGGVVLGIGAVLLGGAAAGISIGSFGGLYGNIPNLIKHYRKVSVRLPDSRIVRVRMSEGESVRLTEDPSTRDPMLHFKTGKQEYAYQGEEALRMAARLLPVVNSGGGGRQAVSDAVRQIEASRGPEAWISELLAGKLVPMQKTTFWLGRQKDTAVAEMPTATRLALEMALHEEAERRAIEGELTVLEAAWREAEEIANIADNLLVPSSVEEQLARMKETPDP